MLQLENDYRHPVTIDVAPCNSLCEWCGKPATMQMTVIDGLHQNDTGYFCNCCGEKFALTVADTLTREITAEAALVI